MLELNSTTAISTRFLAISSWSNAFCKVTNPALRASIGLPCIEPDVSRISTQAQRGCEFLANSTVSSSVDIRLISSVRSNSLFYRRERTAGLRLLGEGHAFQ